MSNLVGAWSLEGRSIAHGISPADRSAMLEQLPGHDLRNLSAGPLWMCASRDNLLETDAAVLGVEGFLAVSTDRSVSLRALLESR